MTDFELAQWQWDTAEPDEPAAQRPYTAYDLAAEMECRALVQQIEREMMGEES